jgi:hypothetical protein
MCDNVREAWVFIHTLLANEHDLPGCHRSGQPGHRIGRVEAAARGAQVS